MPDGQLAFDPDLLEKAFRKQLYDELKRQKLGFCIDLLTRKGPTSRRILDNALVFYLEQRGEVSERLEATVRFVVRALNKRLKDFIQRIDAILNDENNDESQ